MYDVIVVGTRVSGAATAMLLARRGLRVLAVDRAGFPSDTLSTHQVQLPGVARLAEWGLLDRLTAVGTPPAHHVRFDAGSVVLDGHFPAFRGVDAVHSPRRTILDGLLVEAARTAGAEVREHVTVAEVVIDNGTATGIRARDSDGRAISETARLVVGADGKHSLVARAVEAPVEVDRPTSTLAYYTYWADVRLEGGEIYSRDRSLIGAWPTNDGLTLTVVIRPVEDFRSFRSDIEGNLLRTLDLAGDLGQRVRAGRRADRIFGSADLPNRIRRSHGPGWALVGDAGFVMDPCTGQGIGHGLRDAELVAEAVEVGLGGRTPLETALAGYQRRRDRERRPMFDFTVDLALLAPPRPEQQAVFGALAAGPQARIDRFFGVMTGAVPIGEFFGPVNLVRILGLRGMARMALGRRRSAAHDNSAGVAAAPVETVEQRDSAA